MVNKMRLWVAVFLTIILLIPVIAYCEPNEQKSVEKARGGVVEGVAFLIFAFFTAALVYLFSGALKSLLNIRMGISLILGFILALVVWYGIVWMINVVEEDYPELRPATAFFKSIISGALHTLKLPSPWDLVILGV